MLEEFTVSKAVENGGKHHACNSDKGAFVSPTMFDLRVSYTVMGEIFVAKGSEGTLYEERLNTKHALKNEMEAKLFLKECVVFRSTQLPAAPPSIFISFKKIFRSPFRLFNACLV